MLSRLHILIAAIPPAVLVVVAFMSFQLDKSGLDFEKKKHKEGSIPVKELAIKTYGSDNVSFSIKQLEEAEIKITIGGKEINDLYSIDYWIENTGSAPILSTDFSEPLTLKFPDRWEILFVRESHSMPKDLNTNWTKIDKHSIFLEPLLLNPGDALKVDVYLADLEGKDIDPFSVRREIKGLWSVRVPNLKKIDLKDPLGIYKSQKEKDKDRKKMMEEIIKDKNIRSYPWLPQETKTLLIAGFFHDPKSWGVYAIIFLAGLIIYVFMYLIFSLKHFRNIGNLKLILAITGISIFSFASAESYVSFIALGGHGVFWLN